MFDKSIRYFERLPRYNTLIASPVVKSVTKSDMRGKISFPRKEELEPILAFERNEEKTHKLIAAANRISGALDALVRP